MCLKEDDPASRIAVSLERIANTLSQISSRHYGIDD